MAVAKRSSNSAASGAWLPTTRVVSVCMKLSYGIGCRSTLAPGVFASKSLKRLTSVWASAESALALVANVMVTGGFAAGAAWPAVAAVGAGLAAGVGAGVVAATGCAGFASAVAAGVAAFDAGCGAAGWQAVRVPTA